MYGEARDTDFFSVEAGENGFALWDLSHIVWLVFAALVTVFLCVLYRRLGEKGRRRTELCLAALLLLGEAARLTVVAVVDRLWLGWMPLHLCGLAIFIEAFYALRPSRVLGDILYAACMPGALMALLFPDWTGYPPFGFLSQNSFVIHTLLTAFPVMLVSAGKIRPDARNLPKVLVFLLLLAIPMYFLDMATGMNFMFLREPAPGSPLEWFAPLGKPGYLAGYLPIALTLWAALYLPWILARKSGGSKPPPYTQ